MLQVPLFRDEILMGYLSRLAKANRMGALDYFCKSYEMSFHGLNHGKSDTIEMLSSLVGLPSEQLLHHATTVSGYRSVTMFGQTFEQALLLRNTLRFCPKCFEADELEDSRIPGTRRYRRALWLVKAYRTCHVHGCELLELPGRKTNPSFDFCVELDAEHKEIQRLSSGASERPAGPVDLFIRDRFYGDASHGPLIDKLETAVVLNISRVLGVAMVHGRDQTLEQLSQCAICDATDIGYNVLAGGMDQFHDALDRISAGAAAGAFLRYGRFYTHIRQSQHKDSYQHISELFQAHVADRYPLPASVTKFARTNEEKWTTVAHIADVTGLSSPVIRRRLVDAKINTKAIPVKALSLFERMSGGTIQYRQAASILRCRPMFVSQLVAGGVLRRLDFDQIGHRGRHNTRLLSTVEVNELHNTIHNVATSALEQNMLSIKEASERMGIHRVSLLAKIAKGELKRVALSGRPLLVDDVMVDPSELMSTKFSDTHVVNTEAVGILEISQISLRALQNNHLIGFDEVSSDNGAVVYRVTSRAELVEFRKRYVTVNQLIKATGLSQRQVRYMIRTNGVPPAISTAKGGCAFYDRAQIELLIDAASLVSNAAGDIDFS
ncbi:TniQ family protein [Agrobacterium sp. B1(2019)]|uniref:TniQ family protein n=1 Tax=Agrobacterium sp. B1(2019) TaxID=2607032 RepID=UPI0011EEB299|nr:TniQ family protein [Agrobacterium sp. B1(2019)]TZG34287.1 MerR family transcriptional regulator [Agrobacterium sp. B1(2019)]